MKDFPYSFQREKVLTRAEGPGDCIASQKDNSLTSANEKINVQPSSADQCLLLQEKDYERQPQLLYLINF